MKRTQIQLERELFQKVRERAFREKHSISSTIRRILHERFAFSPREVRPTLRSFTFIGAGRSEGRGAGSVSEKHDEELARRVP